MLVGWRANCFRRMLRSANQLLLLGQINGSGSPEPRAIISSAGKIRTTDSVDLATVNSLSSKTIRSVRTERDKTTSKGFYKIIGATHKRMHQSAISFRL